MLLAHLRGMSIEPYYEHGMTSVLRENMLLQAFSSSLDLETEHQLLHLEAIFASGMEDVDKKSVMRSAFDTVERLRYQVEFDYDKDTRRTGAMVDLVQAFEIVKAAGLLTPKPKTE